MIQRVSKTYATWLLYRSLIDVKQDRDDFGSNNTCESDIESVLCLLEISLSERFSLILVAF